MKQTDGNLSGLNTTGLNAIHTTIAIQQDTKNRLNHSRSPDQCYDEFINELVNFWERYRIGNSLCGPGRPIPREVER
jgi:hypothetical protein